MSDETSRPRIQINDVGIDFSLYHHHSRSLWDWLFAPRAISDGAPARKSYAVSALRSVTLALQSSSRLAMVGANGSGKTTLARVLAGILPPIRGTTAIDGVVCAVIGGGEGPHPDATIADTAYYQAIRLGRPLQEGRRWADDAIAFAMIPRSVDSPMRALSREEAGRIHLALGLAAGADIFVLDEAVSSFEPAFQEKVVATFAEADRNAAILVVCERSVDLTAGMCREVVEMQDGEISAAMPISSA